MKVISISANGENNKQDKTTVLEPGDHDFIMRRSYVNYHLAKIRELGDLENLISSGKVTKKPALRKTILSKICDGILRSSFTPFEVRELYRDRLFNSDDF